MPSGPIVVIGSVNMDLICRTPHMPKPGQTVLGDHLMTLPGGKGANQAVAAAKMARNGVEVHMIARIGDDDFGQRLLNNLSQHNINTRYVTVTEGTPSGAAMILVDREGENSIIVAPGANAKLSAGDIDRARALIASASVVLLQLESPIATVRHAISLCRELGVFTILDPAPVPEKSLPRALYHVDLFTPNQTEAEALLEIPPAPRVSRKRVEDPKQIAAELLTRGPKSVVLKLGRKGCLAASDGVLEIGRPYKLKVVDTTAAGDAFTAALAVARAEEMDIRATMRLANAAGALTCTQFGAQPALPTRDAVEKLIARAARG